MTLEQIDLNKLHTFFAVAEHDGVTAAARRLALTPSAVSQSLSASAFCVVTMPSRIIGNSTAK